MTTDPFKPQPSLSTRLWQFTTIPVYSYSKMQILALTLKFLNVIEFFDFNDPFQIKQPNASPVIYRSPGQIWDLMVSLYAMYAKGKVIEIKTEPQFFDLVQTGFKLNEMRLNDRDYQVGDLVIMGEIDSYGTYTGQAIGARINWISEGKEAERWMLPDHCNFGLSELIVMRLSKSLIVL